MTILLPPRPSTGTPAPPARPVGRAPRRGRLVNPRIVAATARRVLGQLRGDRRTVAMLLVVPSALLTLISEMLDSQPAFNKTGLTLLGIFPFTLMFLVTSIAMLRERTSGTLERLLTTPLSKLDLLLGYGVAFAVAATVQAVVTCATAYLVLDLYTPGSPLLVLAVAIAGAVLGMALGLLASAFATSEFQAVQFMPVVVFPQVFLGGLFVPREQMSDLLHAISYALPMTYSIDALDEVGSTSLVSAEYLGDMCAVLGAALLALVLAATTLRRRTGDRTEAQARRLRLIPLTVAVVSGAFLVGYLVDTGRYVTTDNAVVDGDRIPIIAPASGTLVGWNATLGTTLADDQIVGHLQLPGAGAPRRALRSPGRGTVVLDDGVNGSFVTAGTRLGVAYDLGNVYVTARIDESDRGEVAPGQQVDVRLDSAPDTPLVGYVTEIAPSTASTVAKDAPDNSMSSFDRYSQVIPVRIVVPDHRGVSVIPGLNVTVKIHKN